MQKISIRALLSLPKALLSLLSFIGIASFGSLRWFFNNFVFAWLTQLLETQFNIKQHDLVASVSGYVAPLVASLVIVMFVHHLLKEQKQKAPPIPAPTIPTPAPTAHVPNLPLPKYSVTPAIQPLFLPQMYFSNFSDPSPSLHSNYGDNYIRLSYSAQTGHFDEIARTSIVESINVDTGAWYGDDSTGMQITATIKISFSPYSVNQIGITTEPYHSGMGYELKIINENFVLITASYQGNSIAHEIIIQLM